MQNINPLKQPYRNYGGSYLAEEVEKTGKLISQSKELEGARAKLIVLGNQSLSLAEKETKVREIEFKAAQASIDAQIKGKQDRITELKKGQVTPGEQVNIKNLELEISNLQADRHNKEMAYIVAEQKAKEDYAAREQRLTEEQLQNERALNLELTNIREASAELQASAISDAHDKQIALAEVEKQKEINIYNDLLQQKKISYEEYLNAVDSINLKHNQNIAEIDAYFAQKTVESIEKTLSVLSNGYNNLFSAISAEVSSELDEWEEKEKDKLEIEKEAALKHARTQKQRQKINEDFEKREEALEDEKKAKAKERLQVWFDLQKAAGIASAMVNTYQGAAAALAPPPLGAGPVMGPILAAATIAAGLMNVAAISQQQLTGYAKGGAIIGENGPEIIAPFQDYASGQALLVREVVKAVKESLEHTVISNQPIKESSANTTVSNQLDPELLEDLIDSIKKLNKLLSDGITAKTYINKNDAERITSTGIAQLKRSKL